MVGNGEHRICGWAYRSVGDQRGVVNIVCSVSASNPALFNLRFPSLLQMPRSISEDHSLFVHR